MLVIVDAAPYFAALHAALQQARHSVIMIGWEFDTRISLLPQRDGDGVPTRLGKFLSWVVRQNPDLNIYLLEWDTGMVQVLGRGSTPLRIADWISGSHIHLKLDYAHPTGAAHHQKIVVIDDALAFCGGIDTTTDRWDTREHLDEHPLRKRPTTGRSYGPWHDAAVAVDGDAARALGILARDRWKRATGDELDPPPSVPPVWPKDLVPTFEDVDVAISRTAPSYGGREPVHEIEALYLAIIAAAHHSVYIESQYFASRMIAEAIAERLREPDGPEFVIVNPETADGWLEEEAMGSARARLLALIREADHHDHFRLYTPVAEQGTPIYVHAKVVVLDDRLLRVGSSNLNNRSLGMDTECDMIIEAQDDIAADPEVRRRIVRLRNDLIAEHLDVDTGNVETAIEQANGRLIGAIEALRGGRKTLVPFTPPDLNVVEEEVLGENDLFDPERPARRWRPFRLFSRPTK
ncbi:phospholipase D-like domain-containing protein [Citreimonas salinaria]|uniref:Phospholipase D n=1 Tax=Citreimonas salinaria TaxID=321339 RepID=A0A1H3M4F3_9RHOB|nr:phospholipase D-like domain-containing protein [Citreimonas salinaria]SDY71099.1 phospholipase D1/2 [Citreimonas salinaria]